MSESEIKINPIK